jgi:transposase-like protein
MDAPRTLLEAVRYFSDRTRCNEFLISLRWADGKAHCPHCGSDKVTYLASVDRFKCYGKHTRPQFSLKVGTIFEDSPLPLSKWLPAVWLVVNCKNGVSSYEMARDLGVTQKSAWFMNHRIRLALQQGGFSTMSGEVEVDETYIGGKARNMSKARRKKKGLSKTTGMANKMAVMGLLERATDGKSSRIRTKVVENNRRSNLVPMIRETVEKGATVNTDALMSYYGLDADYVHNVIDHAIQYADGRIHTNGMENFWALLKRSINGTYVSVEPFHLFRYLDEQAYRFNERDGKDADRFARALSRIVGRRLTYKALTGKLESESPAN